MANLFDRVEWRNLDPSTALTAERGPERWEAALELLDAQQQFLSDQVAALSPAGTGGGTFLIGTTAQRPTPEPGLPFYDLTLGQLIIGNGSSWDDAMGDPITGSPTPSPQNFTAVGQADNTIVFTWEAVAGADTYQLRDQNGAVSGKQALTGTTTTLGPLADGTRTYSLTATDGGVVSAISNTAVVTLPIAGGGGGGGDATPASILNIGTGGSQNYFNVGIGYQSGHVDKTMAQIIGGYDESPYFTAVTDGGIDYVQFQVFMNGGRTSTNTSYPRSELRELLQNGTSKAAWNASSGSHDIRGKSTPRHLQPNKPWCTIAQIHDADSDAMALKIIGDDTDDLELRAVFYDTVHGTVLVPSFDVADLDEIDWRILVSEGGKCRIYIGGVLKLTSNAMVGKGTGHYAKAGAYPQSSVAKGGLESASEYCRIWLRDFDVTHTS